jgi:hypothetical protein
LLESPQWSVRSLNSPFPKRGYYASTGLAMSRARDEGLSRSVRRTVDR